MWDSIRLRQSIPEPNHAATKTIMLEETASTFLGSGLGSTFLCFKSLLIINYFCYIYNKNEYLIKCTDMIKRRTHLRSFYENMS